MHIARIVSLEQSLDKIFQTVGTNLTWYKYTSASTGLAEFGLGYSVTYYTAYVQGIIVHASPQESQLPGGAYEQGMLSLRAREAIGKDDIVAIGTINYRVKGAPRQVILGPTLFYEVSLVRAE